MGAGSSKQKPPSPDGQKRKRKSLMEKMAHKVKKLAKGKKKGGKGEDSNKNLEDAAKSRARKRPRPAIAQTSMGSGCSTSKKSAPQTSPAKGVVRHKRPKKRRIFIGTVPALPVPNVTVRPSWDESKLEPVKIRKNHNELDDPVEFIDYKRLQRKRAKGGKSAVAVPDSDDPAGDICP